jgi:hypothetical protein
MKLLRLLAPPLMALLLAQSVLAVAARLAAVEPFASSSYVRWDAYRYLQVARSGYYLELVGGREDANTGWFPGYPFLIHFLQKTSHLKPALVGRLIAIGFQLAGLSLLWAFFLRGAPSATHRWLGLLLAAFFPGFVYYSAVFPVSMLIVFALLALLAAADGRFLLAGASGAIAAFTYPTGVLIAGPLLLAVLLAPGLRPRHRLLALLEAPVLCVVGLAAVMLYHHLTVGHWDAFFQQQLSFGHGLTNPLATLWTHLAPVGHPQAARRALAPALQTLVVAGLVLAVTISVWRRRSVLTRGEVLLLAYVFVFWLVPQAVGSGVSIYRAESLLVPIVPLLLRWPVAVLAALVAVFVALGCVMSVLFFQTVLI